MSISVFVFTIIAIVVILTVIAVGYFLLYTRMINKALVGKGRKHLHMIAPYKVVIAFVIVLAVGAAALGGVYRSNMSRITSAHDIEESFRAFQAANAEWNVEVAMSNNIAAVIAYDQEQTDHTFAVYTNENDIFTNYVYRAGGHTTSVERSVLVYKSEGAFILISMNALHIAKIECHDGDPYEIDPNHPFVLIVPGGGFDVYDSNGSLIELEQDWWYGERKMNGSIS